MRYLITISYDGTNFSGYQKQPKERTVQSELEKALKAPLQRFLLFRVKFLIFYTLIIARCKV